MPVDTDDDDDDEQQSNLERPATKKMDLKFLIHSKFTAFFIGNK